MVELRTLHLTDIHDDYEKYLVLASYIAAKKETDQAVDAVFITGDFIEGDVENKGKTAHIIAQEGSELFKNESLKKEVEEFNALIEKHGKEGKVNVTSLDDSIKKRFEELNGKIHSIQASVVQKIIAQSYNKHAEAIGKLGISVFGILGNHDLTSGYDFLKDNVTFLEKNNKADIKGKSGVEFVLKGDLNTVETPIFYAKAAPLFAEYFIPYESGYSLSELSKEVNELQKIVAESQSDRLEKIAKKEEPKYSEEQLKEMQMKLEYTIALRKEVLEYNQAERKRLGDKNEADIYLTHKLPSCKKADPKVVGPLSDVTLEYAANAKAIYGGHFHEGQVGYKTLENLLKQESKEKTTVDGVEVPVYYLEDKEPWELNPGTQYFFVTEYNAKKKIEQVVIHEFYHIEEAA